jgi:methylase of polypeptide subunit release factors
LVDDALVALLRALEACGYDFVTTTPATHGRYLKRRGDAPARTLRDVLGWSMPFSAEVVPQDLLDLMERAEAVVEENGVWRSRYRVARVAGHLFLHSAFPTDDENAVFLGPDTYRFVRFVEAGADPRAKRLVDMGAGTGAGAISAAALMPNTQLILIDANPEALRLARVNAEAAGVEVEAIEGDTLDAVAGELDLVIANPPFIADAARLLYRHGGDMHGAQVSLDWALAAAGRLAPGGRMLLYTGSAIVDGGDALREALVDRLPALGCTLTYREIDPDIFGEMLDAPAYDGVERIAAVGAVIQRLPVSVR